MESTLKKFSKLLHKYKYHQRFEPWFRDNGDKTHRLNYKLDEQSIVFDLGGYEGQWASDIFSKYLCTIHIFEPYTIYAENICQRFIQNKKIITYPFGLSGESKTTLLTLSDDGSSIYGKTGNTTEIKLVRAVDFLNENNFERIDLMKINIEGGEYDLLEHLIETTAIKRITNIQVQFHDFVTNAEGKMNNIQRNLSKTHELTYQYKFVWENWRLK